MAVRKKGQKHLDDMKKQLAVKQQKYESEKAEYDKLLQEETAVVKEIERAQWAKQALIAGMSEHQVQDGEGEGKSLREQLLETQTKLAEMDAEISKKSMSIKHLEERIVSAQQGATKNQHDGNRLLKEKAAIESLVHQKKADSEKMNFDPEQYATLARSTREAEAALHAKHEQMETLRAHIGNLDFNYTDPHRGFDRSKVKGVVAKLFHIKGEYSQYHRALEVCAGGKLFFVVTDNEQTGKALLEHGQLRRRVTIIPLNKVADPSVRADVVKRAQGIVPSAQVHSALQIVGFEKEVQNAMKFVFGGSLLCDTAETAKQVTFHPNVRVRSVTMEGDVYDPAGTLTGGSAPRGGGILSKLQQLAQLEAEVQTLQQEYQQAQSLLRKSQGVASKYDVLERDLKCKEHELALIEQCINSSSWGAADKAVKEMTEQVSRLKQEVKAMPDEEKSLKKMVKKLEQDIKSLDNGREGRLAALEKEVIKLKTSVKPRSEKVEKQREKLEQASIEFDVMRNEMESQEGQDQSTGKGHDALTGDVGGLQKSLETERTTFQELGSRLDSLRDELKQLDATLGDLGEELTSKKQEREEKTLEEKKLSNKVQQLQKDDQEAHKVVARMEQQHPWIEKERHFFGKAGTDFDFEANKYPEHKARLDEMSAKQKSLGKNINKKAMAMFERAEQEYQELLQKRDIILNDKCKIEAVIADLDEKKIETLRHAWTKVNKDFDSIFSTLLQNTSAKLEPPQGLDATEGLEIKVAFNGVWKESLTELSGGQRSLLALSLVLALLKFKPAPMYILDEVDAALDLSHTQNIGHIIRTHFTSAQFIIVSLKDGMFNNANVLFRTALVDGSSAISRYAIRDGDAPPGSEDKPAKKARKA